MRVHLCVKLIHSSRKRLHSGQPEALTRRHSNLVYCRTLVLRERGERSCMKLSGLPCRLKRPPLYRSQLE